MATGAFSLQQLLRRTFVTRVVSRVRKTGSVFGDFYGMGVGDIGTELIPPGHATFTYDYFDNTRLIASVRPRGIGPKRQRPKAAGMATATLIRSYEAIEVLYDKIAGTRRFGQDFTRGLDRRGQSYVTRQIGHMAERFVNLREFAISRMFRGGFDVVPNGDEHYVDELSGGATGAFNVDFQLPATHKDQLAVGDAGAAIIAADHNTAGTDVNSHFLNLNAAAERESGWPIEYVWINSSRLGYYINNTTLQSQGGSAFRVWDELIRGQMNTADGPRARGFEVTFRAIPWLRFKVYDGVLHPGSQSVDSFTASDLTRFIPTNNAIITPRRSPEWLGFAEGTEIIRQRRDGPPIEARGFHSWRLSVDVPAGEELHVLDNFVPVLYVPRAVYYPTLTGF